MIATQPGTMPKRHRRSSPERTNTRRGTSALGLAEARSAGSAQALTAADVLEFLQRLRLDREGFRTLDSGRRLLLEAVETGLVELRELDAFVGADARVAPRRDLSIGAALQATSRETISLMPPRSISPSAVETASRRAVASPLSRSAPAYSSPIAGLLGQAR